MSVGGLGTRGDDVECLRHGLLVHGVPDTEPHPDPGNLAAGGPLAHRRQHALAQAVFVHVLYILSLSLAVPVTCP
jgi:hypothetical protein